MAGSDRKHAAARFRRAIARSNALHAGYLGDPGLYDAYDRFTRWQLDYMLPFFDDLTGPAGYAEAVDFVVSDLAGIGVSDRDREIERAAPIVVRTLPTHALETAAAAVELNAATLEANVAILRALLVDGELPPMTEEAYLAACRSASSYEECMNLVHLAVASGRTLKTLVRIPPIGWLLATMRAPAQAAGFGELQTFLERGFRTFRRISDIDRFLELLLRRMHEVFAEMFASPP